MFHLPPGYELILASQSPRRKQLLSSLGIPIRIVVPQIDERPPVPAEDPPAYALAMARGKALAIPQPSRAVILAADTVVAIDGHILGKPSGSAAALDMLRMLNGKIHQVHTALYLILPEGRHISRACATAVYFHKWPDACLQAYAGTEEPMDKAGAYAIQGAGSFLIDSVDGSVSNVIGLPLAEVVAILQGCGLLIPGAA